MFNFSSLLRNVIRPNCVLCDAEASCERSICLECWKDLPWQHQSCHQCGLPATTTPCGTCLKQPPHFDSTHALFEYAFPVDALLQSLKYEQGLYLADLLASISVEQMDAKTVDCILPMPMHVERIKQRGFNQSLELARPMAKRMAKPLATHHCQRIKNTPPQASLPLKARVRNIKGAFTCSDYFATKRVAIVDDVMTSGASMNELAKTLKAAGAAAVHCWVMARTY